ncbi:ABC transporter ATP-binding protein [Clostridium beijerinckii]|uniref:ABC transporter ATP-binding protein n=1 Tax=Clostridium beijerinckii TaxID=1520 RepID=A0A1S8SEF4_CLOBE|nr:ABC transporter ATP-binding protein [Clostridium beijerinckii]NMF03937.1 ABC transporter ATP-binding protein [Clostridium beijerinckii]NRY62510.1 ABC-2 type transport system ATP-binding protein [Clostridium beijerinckii]OOM63827.1 ABC-type transporter ATP-binding protein EcsA [Clostridium beijerinckii]
MINISNITKSYNGNYNAVSNLNLEIKDGEIYGLLGPNGAGKTTTIKMITGIIAPTSGKIEINGIDISKEPVRAKEQFGYVPDSPDVFLRLSGMEYLNFMADVYGVSKEDRLLRIKEISKRFEMDLALGDKIHSYSHGMRQKIVLMGVLIHKPKVWILDEPMTGLDPKSAFTLKEMMREHADEGNTVVFSTHVLEVAEKVCDKVAIVNKGQLIFNGTLSNMRKEFKENESLEEMFLEMIQDE